MREYNPTYLFMNSDEYYKNFLIAARALVTEKICRKKYGDKAVDYLNFKIMLNSLIDKARKRK